MNRDAAIEAGARTLIPEAWATPSGVFPVMGETWETAQERAQGDARRRAAAVIDAALPHLPTEWLIVNHYGGTAHSGFADEASAREQLQRWNDGRPGGARYRLVGIVPLDTP